MGKHKNSLDNKSSAFINRLQTLGLVSIVLTILISTLSLIGWYLNITALKFIVPISHPMYPKTAIGILFCSFSLIFLNSKKNQRFFFFFAHIFSSATLIIGSWTLIEYVVGKVLLINQSTILWEPFDPVRHFQPSPETIFCLILSSIAIFFMNSSSSRLKVLSETSVLISGGVALLSIAGFLTGANNLYSIILPTHAVGMALQTAIAFVFLSLGILCFIPKTEVISVFVSETLGGIIARRLVLIIVFAPMGVEFIAGGLINVGFLHPTFRHSFVIVSLFSLFLFLSWITARKLNAIDIERKEIQSKLKESEEKYRTLIELAPESIFVADLSGKYIEVNEASCNLLRLPRDEIIGKTIIDLIPQDEKERLWNSKKQMEGSGQSDVSEWKLKRGDGSFVDVEVNAKILSRDRWVAFVRSNEERKKMERHDRLLALVGKILPEALDMKGRLKRAAKLVTDELGDWCSIILLNDDSSIEQLIVYHRNPDKLETAKQLMDLPLDITTINRFKEVIAKKEGLLITKKDLVLFLNEVLQSRRHKLYEKLGLSSVCHIPLIARERAFGLFTVANAERDYSHEDFSLIKLVTEQIALSADNAYLYERAMKAINIREDLIAIVSHDLKNPISAIDIGVQSLKRVAQSEKSADELKIIINKLSQSMDNSVKRSLTLISDLLIFAKIESGGLVLEKNVLDIDTLLEEALDAHYLLAQHRGIKLNLIVKEPHLQMKVDQSKLLQVLSNLIGNALKFTESGGAIQIEVSSKSKKEILFKISDTGSGIKEDELQHIFERYWQPKRTQTQGSGLGLAIVKGIVEAHGGKIWAESIFGKGSTFFFTIPSPLVRENFLNQINI